MGVRMAFRGLRHIRAAFPNSRTGASRTLVIGAGEAGALAIQEMKQHAHLCLEPVAIVDDDKDKHGKKLFGIPIVGDRNSIHQVVERFRIDQIVIAIPSASEKDINEIISICKRTKCKLKILPGVFELLNGNVTVNKIRDVQIEDLLGRKPVKLDIHNIKDFISNKTILVTGGGGSIGSELCRQIARFSPAKLLILDIYENGAYDLQMELQGKFPDLNMEVLIASVRDKARIDSIFKKYTPHVVFHAAAHKHVPLMEHNPTEAIKNNIFGTMNVAEAADRFGTEKFVLISTDKAVNPTNVMGATKRVAEMIIQAMDKHSRTEYVAVRFGNVLGSNGSVIPLFKRQIAEGGPVTVTHPEINRYFMTIPEAVQLVLQAGSMAKGGEIFVLDMGKPVRIVDLARDLIRLSGYEPDVDIKIVYTGLRPGEKLYEELLTDEEGLTATTHEKIFIGKPTYSDISTLKAELEKLKFLLMGSDENIYRFIENLVPTYKRVM